MLTALELLGVLLLVLANGFFVAAEFAFVGVRRSRVEARAAEGDRRAQRLLEVLSRLNTYLSAAQLGITLASLGLGYLGEPVVAHLIEGPLGRAGVSESGLHVISFIIAFSIITSLHIVLGEQAPKLLGLERAERVATASALPMKIFAWIAYWPVRLLDWASARTVRLFGLHATTDHASIYTEEEIRQLIEISRKGGHIEEEQEELINRVFDFSEAEVREAMVPRTVVVALPATVTLQEAEHVFCEYGFSRLPVYRDRLDDIAGVLFMKDLLPCLRTVNPEHFVMERMLHPPLFVPSTAKLGSVLSQMQAAQTHLACVVDEHGGFEGIVTLEDLLEEIVGEINDEYDEESRSQIVEEKDGTYLLDGMLAVRDANRRFNLKIPEEGGYTTMAGFLLDKTGRILRPGEAIEHEGALFIVEHVDRHRIRRIRYKPAPAKTEETEESEAARA